MVVGGHYREWRNDPLMFILSTNDLWFGLENMRVAYMDDGSLEAVVPSSDMKSVIMYSLNRDLTRFGEWCRL